MNQYEIQNLMNLSGFGDSLDLYGIDLTEFSATDEIPIEGCVQTTLDDCCGKLFSSLARPSGRPKVRAVWGRSHS